MKTISAVVSAGQAADGHFNLLRSVVFMDMA
jgi:hypothetical protein